MTAAALHTYTSDHLIGSSVVVHVAERRLRRTAEVWLRQFLDELRDERGQLRQLADELGDGTLLGRASGRVAAITGRVKLRLDARQDDDLRDLLELEMFRTGVEGKLCLWRSLRLHEHDPRVAALDLDGLEAQGRRQVDELEGHRLAAAARVTP